MFCQIILLTLSLIFSLQVYVSLSPILLFHLLWLLSLMVHTHISFWLCLSLGPLSLLSTHLSLFSFPHLTPFLCLLCFNVYLPHCPQCPSFLTISYTLSSSSFSLFYFYVALSQREVYRNYINPESEGEIGRKRLKARHKEILRSSWRADSEWGRSFIFWVFLSSLPCAKTANSICWGQDSSFVNSLHCATLAVLSKRWQEGGDGFRLQYLKWKIWRSKIANVCVNLCESICECAQ